MLELLKHIKILLNVVIIFAYELLLYFMFRNYNNFIYRITHRLSCINMLYVKFFQAIASNNNLIDEKTNVELLKFTDKVPWSHNDIRIEELNDICSKYELVLNGKPEEPINSGMISLVYKGIRKSDNSQVIIKMRRNNIVNRLNDAIENLKYVIYLLSFIPSIHKYHITEIIDKNVEIIRHQTNFNEEIMNIIEVRNNCKMLKYVKIPLVFGEVTKYNPNFILMEYIDGMKMNQIDKQDYYNFAKQVLKFTLVTSIVHGVAHGDLHSGNILFIKDETDDKYPFKIGVVDFGIIYRMEASYKIMLFEFFTNVLKIPVKDTVTNLFNSNIIEPVGIIHQIPKKHYESIINIGIEVLGEAINNVKKTNQMQIYLFLSKLKDFLNDSELKKYGIRPNENLLKSLFAMSMGHGVTLTLCEDNIIELFNTVVDELFHINMLME
jgi:predicted unusual protein kinase regulating ubiquinone biosynthesis (AarF/ABC1/UbiB family)